MVIFKNFFFLSLLSWGIFLNSCNNDILGLFGSKDFESRMEANDNPDFHKSFVRSLPHLDDDYSFIVLADTHIEANDLPKLEKLKEVIDQNDIKFIVFNGDITQNGKKRDVELFLKNAAYLGVPCFPVIGNHDIYFGNWPVWKELLGPTRYRVDDDNVTLLMLDSANACFGFQQLDWLEKELKQTNGRVFVFFHINLFVKSLVDLDQFTDFRERARITSMLKGRCDAVFMGHVHKRITNTVGGVPYLTIEDYVNNTAYCHVWVTPDGVRWEFKNLLP